MTEVLFGMRCTNPVKYAVVKALGARVRFFEISTIRGTFNLKKTEIDAGELSATYPVNVASTCAAFEDLVPDTSPSAQTLGAVLGHKRPNFQQSRASK